MRKTLTEITTGKSPMDLKKQNEHINSERKWRWFNFLISLLVLLIELMNWLTTLTN